MSNETLALSVNALVDTTAPLEVKGASSTFDPASPAPSANSGYFYKKDAVSNLFWYPVSGAEQQVMTFLTGTSTQNTFAGVSSGVSITSGVQNTGFGYLALATAAAGNYNTAFGRYALTGVVDAVSNTAVGHGSGIAITSGNRNTACGKDSLNANITGSDSVAIGVESLLLGTDVSSNTAVGSYALRACTANNNTGIGYHALYLNTSGTSNVAVGYNAGDVITTGSNNIIVGYNADASALGAANQIVIGSGISGTADNQIRIGTAASTNTFIRGIRGVTTGAADAIAVLVDSNGQLGTVSSSIRFKENIVSLGSSTDKLYNLNPVSFSYKTDESKKKTYGLIAEEVDEVVPDIVVRDSNGQIETVQYHLLIPMLLNMVIRQNDRLKVLETKQCATSA